jgi:hypothetical protein
MKLQCEWLISHHRHKQLQTSIIITFEYDIEDAKMNWNANGRDEPEEQQRNRIFQ